VTVNKTCSYNFAYVQSWIDRRLKWNSSDFGDLTYTFIHESKIWTPDLLLSNRYKNNKTLSLSSNKISFVAMQCVAVGLFEVFIFIVKFINTVTDRLLFKLFCCSHDNFMLVIAQR